MHPVRRFVFHKLPANVAPFTKAYRHTGTPLSIIALFLRHTFDVAYIGYVGKTVSELHIERRFSETLSKRTFNFRKYYLILITRRPLYSKCANYSETVCNVLLEEQMLIINNVSRLTESTDMDEMRNKMPSSSDESSLSNGNESIEKTFILKPEDFKRNEIGL